MFVVIIKRVKKYTKTIPLIRTAKNWTFETFVCGVPKNERLHENMYVDVVNLRQFTYQNASPSAPIRPRPVTRKLISTSHQSKLVISRLQIIPFWLLSDGVIRTLSSLAMASKNMIFFQKKLEYLIYISILCQNFLFKHI